MSVARRPLPPTSSLPSLRLLDTVTEEQILGALGNLYALYCLLPTCLAFQQQSSSQPSAIDEEVAAVDSGYTSGNDDEEEVRGGVKEQDEDEALATLRDDVYERSFAKRWLMGFIGRAEELPCFESEDTRQRAVDRASCVLATFFSGAADEDNEDIQITREFQFALSPSDEASGRGDAVLVDVRLNDGLAGRDNADHTDVGLQSWGAAIVFSELICASPSQFGFTSQTLGSAPRIVELGAGTGLVSIVLGKIVPHVGVTDSTIIATDYHPSVLANLRDNITTNFPLLKHHGPRPIEAALLDWSVPAPTPPLDAPADVLVATDVIYEPRHAVWLRDCAARQLASDGVFWLMATVRQIGRFEGISDTVRTAFTGRDGLRDRDGRVLAILAEERLAKRNGVGRADESEYKLFKIGWV
ncbi:putative methyltransferase-domain-containing protein [Biscogniauxia marginata]|nr:putative methyltransferase-domain-containing protein [Biscogniauxia marginata]